MTPAEATRRSRRAQGLGDTIDDPGVLDEIAALIAVTSTSSSGPLPAGLRARSKAGDRDARTAS